MSRILFAIESGALQVPNGPVLYLNAQPGAVLAQFDTLTCVQDFRPTYNALPPDSLAEPKVPDAHFDIVLQELDRDRNLNRAQFAAGWIAARDGAALVLSGAKTDGIDSFAKELRKHIDLAGSLAKSHGKVVWCHKSEPRPAFIDEWAALSEPKRNGDGFLTAPGMFSPAHIDPGSQLLADNLPEKLGARVADLGAGWGWLSTRVLERTSVDTIDLIEASARALGAAKANITDPRAQFIWDDAPHFDTEGEFYDSVVTNPPFHTSRAADPDLGRSFLAASARLLKPNGSLYAVANRQLPYEATLASHFRSVDVLAENRGYKVICARNPLKARSRN